MHPHPTDRHYFLRPTWFRWPWRRRPDDRKADFRLFFSSICDFAEHLDSAENARQAQSERRAFPLASASCYPAGRFSVRAISNSGSRAYLGHAGRCNAYARSTFSRAALSTRIFVSGLREAINGVHPQVKTIATLAPSHMATVNSNHAAAASPGSKGMRTSIRVPASRTDFTVSAPPT